MVLAKKIIQIEPGDYYAPLDSKLIVIGPEDYRLLYVEKSMGHTLAWISKEPHVDVDKEFEAERKLIDTSSLKAHLFRKYEM